jgi:hypothetical protein
MVRQAFVWVTLANSSNIMNVSRDFHFELPLLPKTYPSCLVREGSLKGLGEPPTILWDMNGRLIDLEHFHWMCWRDRWRNENLHDV